MKKYKRMKRRADDLENDVIRNLSLRLSLMFIRDYLQ